MSLPLLRHVYWGNTVMEYLRAALIFAGVIAAAMVGQNLVLKRLRALAERTATDLDDFAVDLLGSIRSPEFYLLAFYIASKPLHAPAWLGRGFRAVVLIAVTYRVIILLSRCVEYGMGKALQARGAEATASDLHTQRNLSRVVNVFVAIVAVVFLLHNLGFHVESMIAGLGIGGVAVALAAQAVLGDFFSGIAIWLDKPFVIGDFIIVDSLMGTVESIGLKTTRVRSLSGELLIFPNASLTSARIRNYKQMQERRVVMTVGVVYGTSAQKIRAMPALLRRLVQAQPKVRFDRAHFKEFADSSLDFELVYYVLGPDYNLYMDIQQALLFSINEEFEKQGLEMAYPTQTVYLANDGKP
ncbi:MAG: mechanosensitive ion channel family protein [Elusimicrobia bacterium]|nr:mechanosensitive ion channel family protein [Elusimicrobiota bacterium]MDE2236928.1 mechanosensitive ion channel family protein [Elusimicrobiota bacterium]MDE2427051.1 mechanosensitive ion channel family protein [Elusimicrobiota bacterium]